MLSRLQLSRSRVPIALALPLTALYDIALSVNGACEVAYGSIAGLPIGALSVGGSASLPGGCS